MTRSASHMAGSIGDLYEALADEAAWAALPAAAARLVGARSCVIHRCDRAGRVVDTRWSYLDDAMMADLARRHPDGRDIWVETGLRHGGIGRAMAVDDHLPEADFLASPLWNDVTRANGDDSGRSMGITHRLDGGLLLLTFQRAFAAGAFGAAETSALDAIATDLHRLHRIQALLGARDGRIARLEALLAAERARVMLVGAGMTLVEASPEARALLDRGDGLALRDGSVSASDAAAGAMLARIVEATIRHRPVPVAAVACRRPGGGEAWRLLVLPDPDAPGRRCLILIRGGGDPPPDRLRLWLRQHHGATAAETAVAEALLAGTTPDAIAAARGVSIHTVRAQIRQLLAKTGERSMARMLVALARLG